MADGRSVDREWALDREIVLSRVFDAPRELVFRAWTEKEHFAKPIPAARCSFVG
jgi:uncharacterized protein YndB with AHSA1/START domain